jgi:hypothetical protein
VKTVEKRQRLLLDLERAIRLKQEKLEAEFRNIKLDLDEVLDASPAEPVFSQIVFDITEYIPNYNLEDYYE